MEYNTDDIEEIEIDLSKKYEPLFKLLGAEDGTDLAEVDTVIVTGGRYSQKSFGVGTFSCVAAKDFVHRVLYTRYTLSSAADSIIPEFVEKIEMLNAHDQFEVTKDRIIGINEAEGCKIVFKGIKTSSGNQTAALKSLKGFSMFVLEEAEEMPDFDSWDKIRKSIRALDVRNINILILNPTVKTHWIYEEFYESCGVPEGFNGIVGNVMYIHTSYLDMKREFIPDSIYNDFEDKRNAWLEYDRTPASQREKLPARLVKKALYYKNVVAGGWLNNAEGVVFEDWEIGDFNEDLPFTFGQDYGFAADPSTLVKCAVDKKRKRIYVKECFGKQGMSTDQLYTMNLRFAGSKGLIVADRQEKRLIAEIKAKGVNIKECVKGAGSVTAGIKAIQGYTIIVDPGSTSIIKELNNYVWHDKKAGVPVDKFNHFIDAIRYAVWGMIKEIKEDDDEDR